MKPLRTKLSNPNKPRPDWFPRVLIGESAQERKSWAGVYIDRAIPGQGRRATNSRATLWDEESHGSNRPWED